MHGWLYFGLVSYLFDCIGGVFFLSLFRNSIMSNTKDDLNLTSEINLTLKSEGPWENGKYELCRSDDKSVELAYVLAL